MSQIIGIVGFIGSGKDTVADYLVNFHRFKRESFANSLKDAVKRDCFSSLLYNAKSKLAVLSVLLCLLTTYITSQY